MNVERRERICALNDQLRKHHRGGRIMLTRGVALRGENFAADAINAIRLFDQFDHANDPYGEHDFGSVTVDGERLFWKIDYYDQSLTSSAVDPSSETGCVRVLTIMLANEY